MQEFVDNLSALSPLVVGEIMDRVPLGICVIGSDFTVRYWNHTLESWTGIRGEEMRGNSLHTRYPHLNEPRYLGRLLDVFEQGTPAVFSSSFHRHFFPIAQVGSETGELMVQETRVLPMALPDSTERVAVIIIQDTTIATQKLADLREERHRLAKSENRAQENLVMLQDGRRAMLNIMDDLSTARLAAEARTHELAQRQAAIDEHAIVSIADIKGNITYVNDKFCAISGYSREELMGQNHRMVKSDEHSRDFYRDLWLTISQGKTWSGEIKNTSKNGAPYWVAATIVPFKDSEGKIEQYVAIRTDITTAKEAELIAREHALRIADANHDLQRLAKEADAMNSELREVNAELEQATVEVAQATRAKSEFLANMSHEIRTPMTAILGFAETLAESVEGTDNVEAIAIIQRNGEHLLNIINDILDLSKIEADKMTVEAIRCNPCQVIAEVVDLVAHRAKGKGLTLNVEYIGDMPGTIHTDPTRLRQILINLIGNAIKFTEEGGIRLIARFVDDDDGPHLQIDVLDTGIGMTPDQITNLFQPFTQADGSTTRRFGGTGLGLTISKRFAAMLGGRLTIVESKSGGGTRFRVTIATGCVDGIKRVKDPGAVSAAPKANPSIACDDLNGQRILLAEDGPDNQRLISFVLGKAGADVTVVENGKLALEAALAACDAGDPFDCILMDMQMPVMSGYEATTNLRQAGYTGPIIALTAHTMEGDREKCIDAGCDDFSAKPINRAMLIDSIARHIQRSAAAA